MLRHLNEQIQSLGSVVLDLLFPHKCAGCGRMDAGLLCLDCQHCFEPVGTSVCPVCGSLQSDRTVCSRCLFQMPSYQRVSSAFCFTGVLRSAVHAFKYDNYPELATHLGEAAASVIAPPVPTDWVLVAVPLHPDREASRGYNQAALLAQTFSTLWQMPVDDGHMIHRIKATPSQIGQDYEARQHNMNGAFVADERLSRDQRILLIDDVCTTGATLDACAAALKTGGAQAVQGFTLARAV